MPAAGASPSPAPNAVSTYAAITESPLSVDALLTRVSDRRVGGIGLFVGIIRDSDEGSTVSSLDYTHHPSAAEALRACADRVAASCEVLTIAVEHRIGHLEIGDLAVVVAVGAVHRGAALEGCRRLIDDLKAEVPIWKEQHFTDGTTSWVGLR